MAVVEQLLCEGEGGAINFGNHLLEAKAKVEDFPCCGDLYKVKTFKTMTKLEKNGMFLYESVPGTSVHNLKVTETGMNFITESDEDAQITVELEADTEYKLFLNGVNAGTANSNLSGKINLSILASDGQVAVKIVKA